VNATRERDPQLEPEPGDRVEMLKIEEIPRGRVHCENRGICAAAVGLEEAAIIII
jgi:hypothetical protein